MIFRVVFFCVVCDILVVRKCCGFKFYVVRLGCYKCLSFLRGFLEKGEIILDLIGKVGNLELKSFIICMLEGLKM